MAGFEDRRARSQGAWWLQLLVKAGDRVSQSPACARPAGGLDPAPTADVWPGDPEQSAWAVPGHEVRRNLPSGPRADVLVPLRTLPPGQVQPSSFLSLRPGVSAALRLGTSRRTCTCASQVPSYVCRSCLPRGPPHYLLHVPSPARPHAPWGAGPLGRSLQTLGHPGGGGAPPSPPAPHDTFLSVCVCACAHAAAPVLVLWREHSRLELVLWRGAGLPRGGAPATAALDSLLFSSPVLPCMWLLERHAAWRHSPSLSGAVFPGGASAAPLSRS